ncbi:uncharacterized protein LOC132394716 [Hypanus sabinus]|uniref:uncharacterized protein LOC132394716 n=1 Tax=Hypanus sabinus TaxID=79690 RepID=UPI0028C40881|nr:uncharacterized protein LOC132394716 [Hypanus sabinus]
MLEQWKLKPVLILVLFQAIFNDKQVVIEAREDHLIGILGESVLFPLHRASREEVREISWEKGSHAFLKCIPNQHFCHVYKQQESRVYCFPDCSLRLSGLLDNDRGVYRAEILFYNGRMEIKIIYLDILGADSLECATSVYLLIISAAVICFLGFVLVAVLFNKRRASRTERQIVNEREGSEMNNEDGGGQYLLISFPDRAQQPGRNGQENADQVVVYSTTASS